MNEMRDRAKEHFPTVLLTLLSIMQALALELLWTHLRETESLFEPSWIAVLSWVQVAATFLGILLIWVVYASNMMRFRWVPVTSDSVYPFLIGLLEFMLIETLGPDEIGLWLMLMGLVFAMMSWVAQSTMRRARHDGDNDSYFDRIKPATLRDFYPQIAIVGVLAVTGVYVLVSGDQGVFALVALLSTNVVLGWQFYSAAEFWERSVVEIS